MKTFRFFVQYLCNHALWLIRMTLAGLVLKGDKGRAVRELRKNGVARIPGYVSEHDLGHLDRACTQALDDSASKDYPGLMIAKPGAIRLKHLNEVYFAFNYFRRNMFLYFVNFCMSGKLAFPSVMLSVTHDGSFKHSAVPGKSTFAFAHDWHIDGINHQLKVQIYLEDVVSPDNGPTIVMPGSNNDYRKIKFKLEQDNAMSSYEDGENLPEGQERVPLKLSRDFEAKYGSQPMLAQRGDIYLFDGSTIHHAGALRHGVRKILWFYF